MKFIKLSTKMSKSNVDNIDKSIIELFAFPKQVKIVGLW